VPRVPAASGRAARPGGYQTFNGGDLKVWSQTDVYAAEVCGNGVDDDGNGATDDGCGDDGGPAGDGGALMEEETERLPTEEALRRLDDLPGIGPWTAGLVLLRGLGRMDVFPAGDVGVQRGLRRLLGAGASLAPLVERLGDRRGYLHFYSLGAQLLGLGLIRPAAAPGRPRRAAAP
jgi:hypothetical protein